MERIADYIIRKVNNAGAKHAFLITGRGILYLTDAVAKNSKIIPVSTFHEQGASFAAMAYASVNDGISACLVSTGCAATNAVTAALCAFQDNLPIVFISGNNQLNENSRHTGVKIRTYGSQETDIISIVQPITKYAVMLESADNAVYEIEKALSIAQTGRKGPVWIDIPIDVQNMRIEESQLRHFSEIEKKRCEVYKEDVLSVLEELNRSKRPVILVGGGARDAKAQIKFMVEKYNIPAVFSSAACDIYGAANELSIGAVGSIGGSRAGNFAVQNSDYILSIGSKLCSQLTGQRKNFAREAKIVAVDIDETEHLKNGVVDRVIISDAKNFLSRLLDCNLNEHSKEWSNECKHWKSVFSIENEQFIKELKERNEVDLYSFADELSKVLPQNATVITDAGFEELIIPSAIKYGYDQRCLFPAAQGAMGYAIPAIIGAYEAGRKNIVCIVGDGSIMMNLQEIQIIATLKIPVKILVINNNMYAVIRKRQMDLFRKRTIGTDSDNGLPQPDFKKIAECFEIGYTRIENRTELLNALPKLFDNRTEIIEVICTPEQTYFHESYTINEKHKLVHRSLEDMSPFLSREFIKKEMVVQMLEE